MKILFHILTIGALLLTACAPKAPTPQKTEPVAAASGAKLPGIVSMENTVVSKGTITPQTPQVKVGLLLPFSGDSAAVGNAMLDAATMAIYDAYLAVPSDQIRSQVVLIPKDTGKTPADAARAAKQVIDQGATFIIGPLFSQSVTAIAPIARERGVPILSFSNNKAVADNRTFVFGLLPEQQVARVADYAFLKGFQRVALLAPNDSYGQKIHEALKETYQKKGGLVTPTEFYAPSPTNIDAAAARMAATYNNTPEERRFQAIFIADGGNQLKNIAASLKKTNIDLKKVHLYGAGLWEDPGLAKIPELYGAVFSAPPSDNYQDFERRFMSIYHYKPMRLAGLAYDAVTLATAITISSQETAINPAALFDPKGFTTPANGLVRFRPDGTSERKLAVTEVTPDGFKIVEPARKAFEDEERTLERRPVQ